MALYFELVRDIYLANPNTNAASLWCELCKAFQKSEKKSEASSFIESELKFFAVMPAINLNDLALPIATDLKADTNPIELAHRMMKDVDAKLQKQEFKVDYQDPFIGLLKTFLTCYPEYQTDFNTDFIERLNVKPFLPYILKEAKQPELISENNKSKVLPTKTAMIRKVQDIEMNFALFDMQEDEHVLLLQLISLWENLKVRQSLVIDEDLENNTFYLPEKKIEFWETVSDDEIERIVATLVEKIENEPAPTVIKEMTKNRWLEIFDRIPQEMIDKEYLHWIKVIFKNFIYQLSTPADESAHLVINIFKRLDPNQLAKAVDDIIQYDAVYLEERLDKVSTFIALANKYYFEKYSCFNWSIENIIYQTNVPFLHDLFNHIVEQLKKAHSDEEKFASVTSTVCLQLGARLINKGSEFKNDKIGEFFDILINGIVDNKFEFYHCMSNVGDYIPDDKLKAVVGAITTSLKDFPTLITMLQNSEERSPPISLLMKIAERISSDDLQIPLNVIFQQYLAQFVENNEVKSASRVNNKDLFSFIKDFLIEFNNTFNADADHQSHAAFINLVVNWMIQILKLPVELKDDFHINFIGSVAYQLEIALKIPVISPPNISAAADWLIEGIRNPLMSQESKDPSFFYSTVCRAMNNICNQIPPEKTKETVESLFLKLFGVKKAGYTPTLVLDDFSCLLTMLPKLSTEQREKVVFSFLAKIDEYATSKRSTMNPKIFTFCNSLSSNTLIKTMNQLAQALTAKDTKNKIFVCQFMLSLNTTVDERHVGLIITTLLAHFHIFNFEKEKNAFKTLTTLVYRGIPKDMLMTVIDAILDNYHKYENKNIPQGFLIDVYNLAPDYVKALLLLKGQTALIGYNIDYFHMMINLLKETNITLDEKLVNANVDAVIKRVHLMQSGERYVSIVNDILCVPKNSPHAKQIYSVLDPILKLAHGADFVRDLSLVSVANIPDEKVDLFFQQHAQHVMTNPASITISDSIHRLYLRTSDQAKMRFIIELMRCIDTKERSVDSLLITPYNGKSIEILETVLMALIHTLSPDKQNYFAHGWIPNKLQDPETSLELRSHLIKIVKEVTQNRIQQYEMTQRPELLPVKHIILSLGK